MTRRRGLGVAALALVAATAVGACGIPTDHSARALDPHALPAALAQASTTSTFANPGPKQPIFLLQNTGERPRLKKVPVTVAYAQDPSEQARRVIAALIAYRPTAAGASSTLTNPIPPAVRIKSAKIAEGILNLDVSNLEQVENTTQSQAFAEIVYTATSIIGVGILKVRFLIDGHPIQVPLNSGSSKSGQAIGPSDFPDLKPAS